jgi:DNA-3-methyladenine glycosylase
MFLSGGHAYVYQIYGIHYCFNVVCGREGDGAAILIRALEPTEGIRLMRRNRPGAKRLLDLCSGPGRLAQALDIDRRQDGMRLDGSAALFIERRLRLVLSSEEIVRTARVGVDYAGAWARRRLRLFIKGNPYVSRAR